MRSSSFLHKTINTHVGVRILANYNVRSNQLCKTKWNESAIFLLLSYLFIYFLLQYCLVVFFFIIHIVYKEHVLTCQLVWRFYVFPFFFQNPSCILSVDFYLLLQVVYQFSFLYFYRQCMLKYWTVKGSTIPFGVFSVAYCVYLILSYF